MIVHIIIEVVLGIIMFIAGQTVWQLYKRERFLKVAIQTPAILESVISRQRLSDPPPHLLLYAKKHELGYVANMNCVIEADKRSQRRVTFIFAAVVSAVLISSYCIGPVYLGINLVLFFLSASVPFASSAQSNATEFILTIALILHRWRLENAKQCDEFIESAWSLKPLYETVRMVQ